MTSSNYSTNHKRQNAEWWNKDLCQHHGTPSSFTIFVRYIVNLKKIKDIRSVSAIVFSQKWFLLFYMYDFSSPHWYHRLRGSASPVLTATHHSYGSPRLSDFFWSRLWGSDPSTDIQAKWLKRRVFTQGCAFCSKSRYFSYPLSPGPLKCQNFANFWT